MSPWVSIALLLCLNGLVFSLVVIEWRRYKRALADLLSLARENGALSREIELREGKP